MAWCELHFFSKVLGIHTALNVLLPEEPDTPGSPAVWDGVEPLPVLYLLAGNSCDHSMWLRQTALERYVENRRLAVVMPLAHRGCYADQKYGCGYFKFISEEVPQTAHRFFNLSAKREENFIAGFSMGGYGAVKAGLLHPERYAAVASMAGVLDYPGFCVTEPYWKLKSLTDLERVRKEQGEEAYRVCWDHFSSFGAPADFYGSDNDLLSVLEKCSGKKRDLPKLHISVGKDDFLRNTNVTFMERLEILQIPFAYEQMSGGHDWAFADQAIQKVLEWLPD